MAEIPGLFAILKKLDKVAKPDPQEPIIEPVQPGETPARKTITRRQALEVAAIGVGGAVATHALGGNPVDAFFPKPTETPVLPTKTPEPTKTPTATPSPSATPQPTKEPTPNPTEVATQTPTKARETPVPEMAERPELKGGFPIVTKDLKEAYKGDEKKQVMAAYARYMNKTTLYEDKDRDFLLKTVEKNYELARTLMPRDPEKNEMEADKDLNDVLKLMIVTSREVAIYRNNGSAESRVKNTTNPEWKKLREHAAKDLAYDTNSAIYKLHPGLVFVETGGDPPPGPNSAGAMGLCQVKEDAGKTVVNLLHGEYVQAKKSKDPKAMVTMTRVRKVLDEDMKYKDVEGNVPNLLDYQTNMVSSMKYLEYLNTIYPDAGMSFWAYHMGPGNKATAIGLYLGLDDKDVNFIQRGLAGLEKNLTSLDAERMLANYVKTHHITAIDLLTSDKVRDGLAKREIYDDTFFYVPRILAGMLLMNS